jgi:hypothetical protein
LHRLLPDYCCEWTYGRLGANPDLTDSTVLHHTDQAVDVIGVKVRNDHQRHSTNSKTVQATAHRGGGRAAVDDDGTPVICPDGKAVALTDIACDQQPITGRPARLARAAGEADDQNDS